MKDRENETIYLDNEYNLKENMLNEIFRLLEKYSNDPNSIDTDILNSKILNLIDMLNDISNNFNDADMLDELFAYLKDLYYYDEKVLKKCTEIKDFEYATEAINYLNDIVRNKKMGLDDLSDYILKNEHLNKYIYNYIIINGYACDYSNWNDYNNNSELEMDKNNIKMQSISEMQSIFGVLSKDSKISLFINKLSVTEILKIFPFNLYINVNDNIISILKQFMKMYMSYDKALLFVDKLDLNESEKSKIIEECYNKKIENIHNESKKTLNFTINKILNDDLDNSNLELLSDVYDIEYNEDLCNKILSLLPDIKNFESLSLLIRQLAKKEIKRYSLDLEYIDVINLPEYETQGNSEDKNIFINYSSDKISEDEIYDTLNTLYHELRHLMQGKVKISTLSIMNSLEQSIILSDSSYYDKHYETTVAELDAREWGYYKTFKLLKSVNPKLANRYLKQIVNNQEFIGDRFMLKDKYYFCKLLNTFINTLSQEEIKVRRHDFQNLRYIIDENGSFYSLENIQEKLNNCNTIEFPFYKAYEELLSYGIDNNCFKFDKNNLNIR